jgi:GDPmannose 4,6-dehydratase
MKKTALITGVMGQDGPYLAKLLLEKNYKVYGMVRRYSSPNFDNLKYLGVYDDIDYVTGDLTDESSMMNIIKAIEPSEVYNLGAQSFVGSSWDQAKFTTEVNALGVLYLLNAIKFFSPTTKFYQASTSELFGNSSNADGIQSEETPFMPRSPYAIAKLYAYWMTVNFRESYNMFCTNGILFNHESPLRGKEFVTRKVTEGVARISLGLQDSISLGNLDSKRDWGFAGDYVEAMWMMMQQEKPDNFIVATGKTHTIRELLEVAFAKVGIKDWEKYVIIDPRFKRPAELHILQGSAEKAKKELGWTPKVSFKELIEMMVDADVARNQAEKPTPKK